MKYTSDTSLLLNLPTSEHLIWIPRSEFYDHNLFVHYAMQNWSGIWILIYSFYRALTTEPKFKCEYMHRLEVEVENPLIKEEY